MNENARPYKMLLVEDEDHLAAALELNFELEGYEVERVGTARDAGRKLMDQNGYDIIVLDVMLPDLSGFKFCEKLRETGNKTPVLMLTARDTVEDRVEGLNVGADDYLTKPFELSELLARVRSLLRRRQWEQREEPAELGSTYRFGAVFVDFDRHRVEVDGEEVQLTKLELDLLAYFATHPGRVLSREELQREVWKLRDYPNRRMVDNFIMRLRRHFEPDPSNPKYFVSVRGAGYKFEPPPPHEGE